MTNKSEGGNISIASAMPGGGKLAFGVKLLAVVTAIMGIIFAWKVLVPDFQQRPTTQWIITAKTTGPMGEANYLEYHAPEYPGADGRQTRPFPGWFCNRARPGDVMLMDLGGGQTGTIFLTRNGRIIARLFNAGLKQAVRFTALSLFPLLSLFPWKNQRVRLTVLCLAGTAEIVVIGIAVVEGLFIVALAHGGGG